MSASIQAEIAETITYKQIEWVELIPQGDLDALLNPPDFLSNIADGSEQDSIAALSAKSANKETSRFQQALTSVKVIKSFDKKAIRIPGYMVPLANDENQNVTEFFIVPYFGACLHMPPPPPNQIIYGKVTKGFKLTDLTEAFWFEGTIHIETTNTENGTSAYGMTIDNIQIFE
ncbi:DUF3299 domain-containing protein [Paraglaciecola aquimarina]|uniref:DUF3299 domain-containing protein n=1 Tax=Paraglaciecola algarum TaxID=3050085 RepID=A0ABS9D509_9ALTE|nr:DUF3299 domain-containing protein [Paraglaciecola sp. G1-23]MCF2947505.1 DUF3299 domain-containing protein [Paraglaciecola sp. G1-23]